MVSLPECGRRSAAIAPRMASSSVEPDYAAFVNAPRSTSEVEAFDVFENFKKRVVIVSKSTATGTAEVRYWFDANGILSALETSERRC